MKKTTAQALQAIEDYLGEERWELGHLIVDIAEGDADLFDSRTAELIQDLFESMPEPDNMTTEDIANNIRRVDTPFARSVAGDINAAE